MVLLQVVLVGAKEMVSKDGPRTVHTADVQPRQLIMRNIGVTGESCNLYCTHSVNSGTLEIMLFVRASKGYRERHTA